MSTDPVFVYRPPEAAVPAAGGDPGLRAAIQPNISAAGWPTDAGSNALSGFKALEDASVVERLRQAGFRLCGSTRMSEFGFGLEGSAAGEALRHREADVELVLDLMGESRVAAARAAVCGFKPSWGLVSRFGLVGLIPSMECCGVLAADPAPIREVLMAAAGQDGRDYSLPEEGPADFAAHDIDPERTVIGVISEARGALPAAQEEGFRAALKELEQAGFTVREMSFPDFPLFPLVHRIVGSVEASSAAGRYDSVRYGPRAPGARNWNDMYLLSRGAAFGPLVKSYLFQGAFFQFERYGAFEDACRIRARLLKGMDQLTQHAEFWAYAAPVGHRPPGAGAPVGHRPPGAGAPVVQGPPGAGAPVVQGPPGAGAPAAGGSPDPETSGPESLAATCARFSSTLFANVTGQPVLYLPPGAGAAHPGLQLAAARRGDGRLLALGEHLLQARRGGR